MPPSSVVVVGTFTDTANFGGAQLQADSGRSGFVVEHVAGGAVTAQTVLPEPIEGENLFVDYNPVADVVAVGGA